MGELVRPARAKMFVLTARSVVFVEPTNGDWRDTGPWKPAPLGGGRFVKKGAWFAAPDSIFGQIDVQNGAANMQTYCPTP